MKCPKCKKEIEEVRYYEISEPITGILKDEGPDDDLAPMQSLFTYRCIKCGKKLCESEFFETLDEFLEYMKENGV